MIAKRDNWRNSTAEFKTGLAKADAVIVGDYGKGVVTQPLLNEIKLLCRERGVWLSLATRNRCMSLNLSNLSLITPNRKEAFELANLPDETKNSNPFADKNLMLVAERLLNELRPALLLITLGELGMLLCQRGQKPFHIPTVAQEVFDVSGAGDTVDFQRWRWRWRPGNAAKCKAAISVPITRRATSWARSARRRPRRKNW